MGFVLTDKDVTTPNWQLIDAFACPIPQLEALTDDKVAELLIMNRLRLLEAGKNLGTIALGPVRQVMTVELDEDQEPWTIIGVFEHVETSAV